MPSFILIKCLVTAFLHINYVPSHFSAHISTPKLLHWGFCLYFSLLRSTSVRSSVGFKISARVRQSSMTSNTLWASVNFFGQITIQKYFLCVHSGALDLIYPEKSLYEHILWIHLEKNRTYPTTFPVQRKEINAVVKALFTMTYSSRKLNNGVITTARNFWRQITCSF